MIRKRILLCEDNRFLRKMFVDLLKNEGHHVLDFDTADEALLLGRDEFASIDVLLTDVEMPGTDGIELAKRMSVTHPSISIFLMSGKFVDLEIIKQIPAKFFHKPFSVSQLILMIREAKSVKGPQIQKCNSEIDLQDWEPARSA